jgi:hypothetical protein
MSMQPVGCADCADWATDYCKLLLLLCLLPACLLCSCYFKDEVQRQALEKLNQKRKWYQQQLEAERMVARSMAKSRQAAAAARGNKPAGRPGAPA